MKKRHALVALLAMPFAIAALPAAETLYPLANPSFESPTLSSSNSWFGGVDSWGTTPGSGTTFENPWVQGAPTASGNQFVYGDYDNWDMWQQTGTLAANTRYRLLVDIYPLNTGTPRADVVIEETEAYSVVFAEKYYHPTWAPTREDFTLPAGQWTTVELKFTSSSFPTYTGNNFRVRIKGHRINVDNVRLYTDNQIYSYHVSSSSGNNSNAGTSGAPWADFTNVASRMPLLPGESVYLKAGDTFTQELNIRGKGTASTPIEIGRYGTGNNPIIRRTNKSTERAITWNNASHGRVSGIDVENSKLGVYLRYEWTDSGSQNVTIEDCHFRDLDDGTLVPENHNYEYAFSDAIFIGGQAWNTAEFATRVNNVTIRNCTATRCAHLFGTSWYYPGIFKSRVTNLYIEDCWAIDNSFGSISLINVDGGWAKRVHAIGGGKVDSWAGNTLGMIQSSKNFLIEDCEFGGIDRAQSADGCGFDFEGNTENVTFQNNTVHHNDAAGLLILTTEGLNTGLVITGNTFYSNARDPWNSEINSEIQGNTTGGTGVITNNGIYRGDGSINFLSPSSNWSGFSIVGNRQLEYASVEYRPTWWNFNTTGNLEGWGGFQQWTSNTVSGGNLWGQSTGVDPYAYSPMTWMNSTLKPYVWVRMSQTAGTQAEIFYITDADQAWNGTKRVGFPIIADGTMRDYFVDLDAAATAQGVITQVRLDPTTVGSSNMAVDHVRLTDSTNPSQPTPPAVPLAPVKSVFTSVATDDGEILESAQNSGIGGTISSTGTTFRLGDDASNRGYRQLMSFSTAAIPDDAIITEATLSMTRVGGIVGTIPIGVANSPWGLLNVDVANPSFGASGLATGDWQAAPTKSAASQFAWPAYLDGMTINSRLEAADLGLINKTGRTQFRVRYQNDDDADNTADYVSYATGNHATGKMRPKLTIKWNSATPWRTIMYDNFEGGLGSWTSGGVNALLYTGSTYAWEGNNAANLQDDTGVTAAINSPVLDLHTQGFTQVRIDFRFHAQSFETGENFYLEYFNGTAWVILSNYVVGTNFTNNALNSATFDLNESSYVFPTNAQLRFRSDASDQNDDIYLDEINVLAR
jgi:hypothetical protein